MLLHKAKCVYFEETVHNAHRRELLLCLLYIFFIEIQAKPSDCSFFLIYFTRWKLEGEHWMKSLYKVSTTSLKT